jgi:hypothetical protein
MPLVLKPTGWMGLKWSSSGFGQKFRPIGFGLRPDQPLPRIEHELQRKKVCQDFHLVEHGEFGISVHAKPVLGVVDRDQVLESFAGIIKLKTL